MSYDPAIDPAWNEYEDEIREADGISERVDELTRKGGDLYPWDCKGVAEAIGASNDEQFLPVCEALGRGECELAGRLLMVLVDEHFERRATKQARQERARPAEWNED
jgi:hypothetical protein